uniref:4-hydroxy-2-oxoglutarate aldolase, mitochondrial n=1 Tax=Plectus sambesii TaxID=2011161 RepID=A0A914US60_9BILA
MRRAGTLLRTNNVLVPIPNTRSLSLAGILCPITTPFNNDTDRSLALDKLEHNFNKWSQIKLRGYVALGSAGEFFSLSRREKLEFVAKARELTPENKVLIAGSGCKSTGETIELSKELAKLGVDAVLVITPSYFSASLSAEALEEHFLQVADQCPAPVIAYSVPTSTGEDLTSESVVKLANHPNIIGLKDSGGDIAKLSRIVHETRSKGFQVLAGSAGFQLPALYAGCVGGVDAAANCLGKQLIQLMHQFNNNPVLANGLQGRLIEPNAQVTRKLGIPALKYIMDQFGYYGGPVRSPLRELTQEQKVAVRSAFELSGFLHFEPSTEETGPTSTYQEDLSPSQQNGAVLQASLN